MTFPQNIPWNERLRIARAIKGITQEQLATAIGSTRKQVYRWEHGLTKPNAYTRRKLSQEFGITESKLFWGLNK